MLSRQPENLDNYTLAVIFVNKVYQNPEKRKRIKKIVMITVIVVIAAIVIGVVLWFLRDRKVQRTEDMNYHFTNTVEYINTGNYVRAKEECEQAQKLAEKLKDSSMRNRLQEYSFVIETVILADESYSSADYEAAEEYYLSALDRTRYADNVGTDYIENKLENISVFLSVEDYINLGDSLLEQGDYDGAEEKYLLAKKLHCPYMIRRANRPLWILWKSFMRKRQMPRARHRKKQTVRHSRQLPQRRWWQREIRHVWKKIMLGRKFIIRWQLPSMVK